MKEAPTFYLHHHKTYSVHDHYNYMVAVKPAKYYKSVQLNHLYKEAIETPNLLVGRLRTKSTDFDLHKDANQGGSLT